MVAFTCSSAARAQACPPSCALPQVWTAPSEDALLGTTVHAFLADLVRGVPADQALERVVTDDQTALELCKKIDPRRVPQGGAEVAVALCPATGEVLLLEGVHGRHYPELADDWIVGTIDASGVDPARVDVAWVWDWKVSSYGFRPESHRPQVEAYALAFARLVDASEVICTVAQVPRDTGAILEHGWTLDEEELIGVQLELREAVDAVRAARAERRAHEERCAALWRPDVAEGEHCEYCPALLSCPAKREAIQALLGLDLEALTRETAARAFLAARTAEEVAERVRRAVGQLVDAGGPIVCDGGRIRRNSRGALGVGR